MLIVAASTEFDGFEDEQGFKSLPTIVRHPGDLDIGLHYGVAWIGLNQHEQVAKSRYCAAERGGNNSLRRAVLTGNAVN